MKEITLEEVQESVDELIKKAKDWFSNGEIDVDLMIKHGVITENQIVDMYLKEKFTKFLDYDSLLPFEHPDEEVLKDEEVIRYKHVIKHYDNLYKNLKELAMKYKISIITGVQKKEVKDYDLG